jgi:integrase
VSELRGLRRSDIDFENGMLVVNQSYWGKAANETKTEASLGAIPMIENVVTALNTHREAQRKRNPHMKYVFEGSHLAPLHLESTGSKKIKPVLKKAGLEWHGWHAFRRGLGTTLRAMEGDGVKMETIAAILRHANSKVTEERYAKPSAEANAAAMNKLNEKVGNGKSA